FLQHNADEGAAPEGLEVEFQAGPAIRNRGAGQRVRWVSSSPMQELGRAVARIDLHAWSPAFFPPASRNNDWVAALATLSICRLVSARQRPSAPRSIGGIFRRPLSDRSPTSSGRRRTWSNHGALPLIRAAYTRSCRPRTARLSTRDAAMMGAKARPKSLESWV